MKKLTILLSALLLVGSVFGQKAPTTKLVSSSEESIVVNVKLNGFSTTKVLTPQGEQAVVNVPKMYSMLQSGAPDLPMFPIPTIIGDRAEMTVSVIDAQYTDYSIEVAPSKGNFSRQINPEDVPYTYGEMYQQDAFWPATQAYLEKPYILRDFRGQNIMVRPFAYNPVTKTLRVYTEMTIAMTKVSDNGTNQKAARKNLKIDPEQKAQYERRFINFGTMSAKYPFDEDLGELLIICTDAYMDNLRPLVEWKNESGRPTTLVSLSEAGGNNASNIKDYISNFYNDPAHNLEFILLVGEYEDLTPYSIDYEKKSDNWFGKLEGTDDYLEAMVGRLSVSNANDVDVQVNKIIYYERDILASAEWANKGMGIGYYNAGSGHFGEDDYQHIDFIRDTLLNYTYTEITEHHGGYGGDASTTTISGTINDGIGIINYCNHGSITSWGVADYSVSDVSALTNDNKLPIVWSVACLNGQFDTGTCFGESWLRANNSATGAPTGAIGGMFSWISQPWIPPMYGQDEMVNILTEWHSPSLFHHTLGGVSLNGSMFILDAEPNDSNQTFNTWLLFGDPSLMVRTDIPSEMNVSTNPGTLMLGMSELDVNADADYAIVTLSMNDEVLATSTLTDGQCTLTFPTLNNIGTAKLVVLGYNKVTSITQIEVLPAEGAYISVDAFTPGAVPTNQEQHMSITFKNIGVDPTPGTTNVVISSPNPNVTFHDYEGSFGVLAANETVTMTDEFSFTVAPTVPDGTRIQIDILATCGSNTWTSKAMITVNAPIIEFEGFGSPGLFEPGQTLTIGAFFVNTGHDKASNAIVTASSTSPYVTFESETMAIGDIYPGFESSAQFTITIDETCPIDEALDFAFVLVANNGNIEVNGQGALKNSCNVVFSLVDSYGDGWNGNILVVEFSDGTPTQNLTIEDGNEATYTFDIQTGTHVTLSWTSGNYAYECSFTVSYEDGEVITSEQGSYSHPIPSSYHFEFDVNCAGDNTWSVEDNSVEFNVYPNPVNNTLYIQAGDSEYNYVMYNGLGQEVAKGIAQGTHQINVGNMAKGIYILRLTTGDQVSTQKIVVE